MIRKIFSLVFDEVETNYLLKVISVPNFAGEMGSTTETSAQLSRLSFVVFILLLCIENGEKKGFSRLPPEFLMNFCRDSLRIDQIIQQRAQDQGGS